MTAKNVLTRFAFLFLCAFVIVGCDSDDPDEDGAGEEELITRVTITLTPTTGAAVVAVADDPDGDGSGFQIGTITLAANTTYTGTIQVTDEINGENITEEVEEEADEHQFWYTPSASISDRVTVTINDQDSNGLPLGLAFTVTVSDGGAASGEMQVVLSHYDEGPKDGVTLSDESDVDIAFPVEIQ